MKRYLKFIDGKVQEVTADEVYDAKPIGVEACVKENVHFESQQLPKWSPHHKGEFSPSGKPRFTSRREANEYAKRASGSENTIVEYGEL